MWDFIKYQDNIAIIDNSLLYSYNDLSLEIEKISNCIQPRALVLCLCSNQYESLLGYISFITNKNPTIMLSSDIDISILEHYLHIYTPSYIYLPKENFSCFSKGQVIFEGNSYKLLKLPQHTQPQIYNELALLLTTSGSTGSPKLVRQSYNNILSNTQSIVEYLNLTQHDITITTLPMNYTYGLSIINTHLYTGGSIVINNSSILEKKFWDSLVNHKVTNISGVPYTYEMLNKLKIFSRELPNLQLLTQAGGKLAPHLQEKFALWAKEKNKKFIIMYGQTEATARMGYLPDNKTLEKNGAMGVAIPNGKFELIDENNQIIHSEDKVGELIYYGPNVTLGYAEKREDLSLDDKFHGKLYTGDMAKRDKEGYYYIVGRKKRFLKVFGNRINLDEIELLLKSNFNINCACGGIDDLIYIFITKGVYEADILTYLLKITKLNKQAFKFIQVEEIPKSDSGKTLYKELEKFYENNLS